MVNEIFRIIRRINREGTTVLLVEQNVKQAMKVSPYAYVLETGKIVLSGYHRRVAGKPQAKRRILFLQHEALERVNPSNASCSDHINFSKSKAGKRVTAHCRPKNPIPGYS